MGIPTPNEMFTDVTVKRYAAGSWSDGEYIAGAETSVSIRASIQPAKPEELQNLSPAAQRASAGIKIYSESLLRTANESTGVQADRVVWAGENWEIQFVSRHPLSALAHYKAIATRLDRA